MGHFLTHCTAPSESVFPSPTQYGMPQCSAISGMSGLRLSASWINQNWVLRLNDALVGSGTCEGAMKSAGKHERVRQPEVATAVVGGARLKIKKTIKEVVPRFNGSDRVRGPGFG